MLTGPAINIMGSLFSTLACVALLPILSMSLFIYDRQFFAAERASRLYPARYPIRTCGIHSHVDSSKGPQRVGPGELEQ